MSVFPRTQLGYTLGIKRNKDIYGQGEKPPKNPLAAVTTSLPASGITKVAGFPKVDQPPKL